MSRVSYGLIAAALGSAFTLAPGAANAGCCGWPGNCCNTAPVVYQQPQVYYVQPAPTVVQVQPAPIVVQVAPPQVIVQQQAAYEAVVPTYLVNQGPVYSGPGADYAPAVYEPAQPVPAYPYVRSYRWRTQYYGPRRHPAAYRSAWRYHHRAAVKKYYK